VFTKSHNQVVHDSSVDVILLAEISILSKLQDSYGAMITLQKNRNILNLVEININATLSYCEVKITSLPFSPNNVREVSCLLYPLYRVSSTSTIIVIQDKLYLP
jgi:hypothetical protein